jgi:hypothetical protein
MFKQMAERITEWRDKIAFLFMLPSARVAKLPAEEPSITDYFERVFHIISEQSNKPSDELFRELIEREELRNEWRDKFGILIIVPEDSDKTPDP